MAEDVKAKLVAADRTIDLLHHIADEARQHGVGAKLESTERAIEGETQRKAAINPSSDPQISTFFVGAPDPPAPLEPYSPALESAHGEAFLVVSSIDSSGWELEFPLLHERTIVGRDPDVDVTLDDDSVSRRHAAIIKSGERYYLRDLQSKNGTYFHGVLQGTEQELAEGDCFRIGNSDFVFRFRKIGH